MAFVSDATWVFDEFPNPTGVPLAWVQAQVRVVFGGQTWVSEGIGKPEVHLPSTTQTNTRTLHNVFVARTETCETFL